MPYTFADLRTPETVAVIRARLVAALVSRGVPVSSWPPSSTGGVENLRLDAYATLIAATTADRIAAVVNMRVVPLAVRAAMAEATPGRATLGLKKLGRDFHRLGMRGSTSTVQNMRFSTFGTPPTYTFQPGEIWVRADATGNRYNNLEGGVLTPGQTLDLPCQAENPGASYDDVGGTVTTMVTAKAGVLCTNVRPSDFTPTRSAQGSSGTFVARYTDPSVTPTFSSVRVKVTAPGEIGTAVATYTLDGGLTWSPGFVVGSSLTLPGGATLAFSNGTPPSFITGDVLTSFLGDPILQRGNDAEAPDAFGRRLSNRFPALAGLPNNAKFDLWAHQASPEVERVFVFADPDTAGGVVVVLASASGPASPQAQVDVEDYITARLLGYKGVPAAPGFTSIEETVLASSAKRRNVVPQGTAYVKRNQVAAVQQRAAKLWGAYLRTVPLGGQHGAFVVSAQLERCLEDAGCTNTAAVLIGDGHAAYVDMGLAPLEVAVMAPGRTLQNTLLWVPV